MGGAERPRASGALRRFHFPPRFQFISAKAGSRCCLCCRHAAPRAPARLTGSGGGGVARTRERGQSQPLPDQIGASARCVTRSLVRALLVALESLARPSPGSPASRTGKGLALGMNRPALPNAGIHVGGTQGRFHMVTPQRRRRHHVHRGHGSCGSHPVLPPVGRRRGGSGAGGGGEALRSWERAWKGVGSWPPQWHLPGEHPDWGPRRTQTPWGSGEDLAAARVQGLSPSDTALARHRPHGHAAPSGAGSALAAGSEF